MELLTASLVAVSVTAVAVGAAFAFKLKSNKVSAAEAARARAFERATERQFLPTSPGEDDMFKTGIDFSKESRFVDFGYTDLDQAQKEVVALILDGYAAPITKEPVRVRGGSAHSRAGIPVSQSVFAEFNDIDLDTSWMARGRE